MSIKTSENFTQLLPRVIRIRDAPWYLGCSINFFNAEIRPSLTEIKIGTQGIAFDRLELDAWFDAYKKRVGKPGKQKQNLETNTWQRKSPALLNEATVGISTSTSRAPKAADAFAKALAQATSKKRKASSRV